MVSRWIGSLREQAKAARRSLPSMDFEFVSTTAISTSTTLVVTGMEAGFDYTIQLEAFSPTDDAETIWMRMSDDGGISYEAGASDYSWDGAFQAASVFDYLASEIALSGTRTSGNDATNVNTMTIDLPNPNASDARTTMSWQGHIMDAQATVETVSCFGGGIFVQGTNAVAAVQFLWSGGSTFKAQGNITVWRRKRS
jgi:hypothetical protein